MYIIGKTKLGTLDAFTGIALSRPLSQYEWNVTLYTRDGGLKKQFVIGQADCPIERVKLELNKKLCGAGSIDFAYLDFPLDMADYVLVYFFGELVYRGKIENIPDPKGGQCKLTSYSERFQNIVIFQVYNDTIENILEDIIKNRQPNEPKVKCNPYLIDIDDTDTYTFDFTSGKTIFEAINEIVGMLDDTNWGVDENNFFVVYQQNTVVDKTLFNNYQPIFSSVEIEKDYSKISSTRYEVFRKVTGSNETIYVSQVGGVSQGISVESEIGEQRIGKYIVSEVVGTDAEAEAIALSNLKALAITPISIKIKDVNLDYWFPKINERVTIQDTTEYILKTIINCNALTNDDNTFAQNGSWSNNVSLSTTYSITGGYSIRNTANLSANEIITYDFGELVRFYYPQKLGFMFLSSAAINDIIVEIGYNSVGWSSGDWSEGDWSENTGSNNTLERFTFNNLTANVWQYYSFNLSIKDIRFINFVFPNNEGGKFVYIDRIQLFLPSREVQTANVIMSSIEIKKDGATCNVTLNDYDKFANDEDFANAKRIKKLEALADNT